MNVPAVETTNLTKKYGRFTAIENMDLVIEPNKIHGLLGRNGAGKTSLLNIVATHNFPTSGQVKIFGEDPLTESEVLKKVCYVRENTVYPFNFKLKSVLDIVSDFYPYWDADFAQELVHRFNLNPDKKLRQLSKGMFSALGAVIGLASRAPLTILDEPSLGLDAVARETFYDSLLEDYMNHPRTILLSTHLIDEVSKIFEKIVIVKEGKVILNDNADLLRNKGHYLSGNKGPIEELVKGKMILNQQNFGSKMKVAIFSELLDEEKEKAKQNDIDINSIPMQKLFVYLTEDRNEVKL